MSKERWVEVLVVGVILATLAWLSVNVYSLNSVVSRVDGAAQETSKRLDRIAEVLPDMRVKIAAEELRKRADLALVCQQPHRNPTGEWQMDVSLMDFREATEARYRLPVESPTDRKIALVRHTMRGTLVRDENRVPLTLALQWAEAANSDLGELADVDTECSSIFHGTTKEYSQALAAYRDAIEVLELQEIETAKLENQVKSIEDAISSLNKEVERQ